VHRYKLMPKSKGHLFCRSFCNASSKAQGGEVEAFTHALLQKEFEIVSCKA
jgi:hypothetical protein